MIRDDLITYIEANLKTGFNVSQELPWQKDGQPLYVKNMKRIYVDNPQTTQEPLYDGLDGSGAVIETTTVQIYIATDAKNLPSTYDEQVTAIKRARTDVEGASQLTALVSTEYITGDALSTEIEVAHKITILNE